jgi:hypothetical protein
MLKKYMIYYFLYLKIVLAGGGGRVDRTSSTNC